MGSIAEAYYKAARERINDARQEIIWNLLHAHLTQEERQQILGFLTYTLQEEKAYSEAFDYAD